MNTDIMVRNLLNHWNSAADEVRVAGVNWYPTARIAVANMASRHKVSYRCAAGVIAAMSPRLHWVRNLAVADMVLGNARKVPGVFRINLDKARRIRAGHKPLTVLSGPKVRAFYRALIGDDTAAVIDVWTVCAVGWTANLTEKAYHLVADALRIAAAKVRTSVAAMQAVAWVVVRGKAS